MTFTALNHALQFTGKNRKKEETKGPRITACTLFAYEASDPRTTNNLMSNPETVQRLSSLLNACAEEQGSKKKVKL